MNAVVQAHTLSQCLELMSEYASAYEAQGGQNLIFCEDRLTLLAERALLKKVGGTFASGVATFARFLKTDAKTITKQGSVMAVGEIMTRLQRENALQCFTSITAVGNNARCIYETLAQFSASEITPQVLREGLSQLPEDMLKRKISDLALIYEEYLKFLADCKYLDESQYLALLPPLLRKHKWLAGTNVIFLGYTSFTVQARELIRAVLETADNVIGIFYTGEEELYANRAMDTFACVCGEFGKVQLRRLGKPLEGEAEVLRKGLFNPVRMGAPIPTDKLHIFEAEDKTAEAEYVAVKIRRAIAEDPGLRYRDFSVLVPDVLGYSLALKKALEEYEIPYFIDEKKSLKSHPLSRFLLDCFRVVKESFSPASVQSLTQNVFFGESDEYRNYLWKFANYRWGAKREIKTGEAVEIFDREKLLSGRERVLKATENIKTKGHGRGYCMAVRDILSAFNVKERLEQLENEIGDLAWKGYLSQIWRALDGVLAEAELLTGNKEMSVAEFAAVLEDGLSATEISLIPLKTDAVFIGDITDSRIERAHTVFAMGMTESVPRSSADTAIVSDKEIARLAEVKALLEPTVAEVNLRARESVCLNLCAFTNTLHLSYPLAADGGEPSLSDVFRYVDRLFCAENGRKLPREKGFADEDFAYRCSANAPAVRQLLIEKNKYENALADTRTEYSSLYAALKQKGLVAEEDFLKCSGQVSIERGEELFFHDGKVSPTSLEGYFSCPFRHFAERGLKLKEREEAAVLAVDTGNFIHELLEKTIKRSREFASAEDFRAYALSVGEELLKNSIYAMQQDTESGLYFSGKLLQEGADVAVAAYRQVADSEYNVEQTEVNVSAEFFHGKVDRVDGTDKYVRIIDYKTGTIDDQAASYYTGRKLQLQLYMSELKGERVPAGVFYFPASVNYDGDTEGKFRMQGFLNGNEEALLAGDKTLANAPETQKSAHFPAALKNSASAKRIMDEETFRDFLDYSVFVARQGCKELKEGYIAPSPYEGHCTYCKYGGMCGFEKDNAKPRKESSIDPSAIAKIAKTERDGKED